jgi:hypothetical protein
MGTENTMHLITPTALRVLGGALLSLAACAPVEFTAQEIHLRHDVEADALEFTLLYEGLAVGRGGSNSRDSVSPLQESTDWVRRLAAGERVFILFDWPLVFDLEDPTVMQALDSEPDQKLLALVASIESLGAAPFIDDQGRLCAEQRLRWNDLQRGLQTVNERLNLWLLEEDVEPENWKDHLASRRLLLEHLRARRPFLTIADGALEVRVPLGPDDFAAFLRSLVEAEANADSRAVALGIFSATEISLDDKGLLLRYEPGPDGGIHLRFERPGTKYDDRLAAALRSADPEAADLPLPMIPLDEARAAARR